MILDLEVYSDWIWSYMKILRAKTKEEEYISIDK
jgi:hypothetical protein